MNHRKINIKKDLKDSTFNILQNYYRREHQIELKKEDLCAMDVGLLAAINYNRLQGYRGFGKIRMYTFKKLMVQHSVLDPSEL